MLLANPWVCDSNLMRNGFYSIKRVVQEGADEEAFGVAILVHFKDGRFIGVDQGGCTLSGIFETRPDGSAAVRLLYAFHSGTELPNGTVLEADTSIRSEFILDANAAEGVPQNVDFGIGPVLIRFDWLAEPA